MVDHLCIAKYVGGYTNLKVIEKAASFQTGNISIFIPKGREDNAAIGNGISGKTASKNVGIEAFKSDVRSTKLDDHVREHNISSVTLLKIDTQGHELFVLRDTLESLRSGLIQAVFLENDNGLMSSAGVNPRDVFDLLDSCAFEPYSPSIAIVDVTKGRFVPKPKGLGITGFTDPLYSKTYDILWLKKKQ